MGFLIHFAGLALVYAALASALVLAGLRLWRGAVPWAWAPLIFCAFTFFFLTQHPFPDLATMSCPRPGGAVRLQPLGFLVPVSDLLAAEAPLAAWLSSRWVMATVMNFVLCAGIGVLWGRLRPGLGGAALAGFGLSLVCELTQLTGVWGIYPCAYRSFNVDDLLLNTLGVLTGAAGVALVRRVRRGGARA